MFIHEFKSELEFRMNKVLVYFLTTDRCSIIKNLLLKLIVQNLLFLVFLNVWTTSNIRNDLFLFY